MNIKRMELPYYIKKEHLRTGCFLEHYPKSDFIEKYLYHGSDGWYKYGEFEWMEFEGKIFYPKDPGKQFLFELNLLSLPNLREVELKALRTLKTAGLLSKKQCKLLYDLEVKEILKKQRRFFRLGLRKALRDSRSC